MKNRILGGSANCGFEPASYYYIPGTESALNLELMRWLASSI